MAVPKITSRILVFNEAGKVLLIKRSLHDDKPNLWDLPGGKMEAEDLDLKKPKKECARRELKEETGLFVKKNRLKPVGEVFYPLKGKLFCLFRVAVKGKPKISLSKEHTEAMWFNPNQLPADMNPSTVALIRASNTACKLAA